MRQASHQSCSPKKTQIVATQFENLLGLLEQLREEGVQVEAKVEGLEYGKFDWIVDPEASRNDLWEPPKEFSLPGGISME